MDDSAFESEDVRWFKSTRSEPQGECVEAAASLARIGIRDSKLGADGPILSFPWDAWTSFTQDIRIGRYDNH